MKKLISVLCALVSVLVLTAYFVRTSQVSTVTDLAGLLLFVPTVLSIPGMIFAYSANRERRSSVAVVPILVNALLLFSIPLMHFGGTLIFGA